MDQKKIQTLAFLLFCQYIASEPINLKQVRENGSVKIHCSISNVQKDFFLLRVDEKSGMKVIGYKNNKKTEFDPNFNYSEMLASNGNVELKSFLKTRDRGTYSCATFSNNGLVFGEITRLEAAPPSEITTKRPPFTTTNTTMNVSSTQACVYNREVKGNANVFCKPVMLGSLAGGCGLLLLLLIITIGYCNRTRTRGCPHHNKRKLAPGKQENGRQTCSI